jgi:hypothetical protein
MSHHEQNEATKKWHAYFSAYGVSPGLRLLPGLDEEVLGFPTVVEGHCKRLQCAS